MAGQAMAAVRGGVSAPEFAKEGAGRMRSSPRTHFGGLFGRRMTREADRRRQSFERPPMVTGDGWGDSGRAEAGLEVGEGGGGAGEGARTRNRSTVTGGVRSREGRQQDELSSALAQRGRKRVSERKIKTVSIYC